MFRPIKNLLTYIQKNAGGSTIFGGAGVAEVESESEEGLTVNPEDETVKATKDEIVVENVSQQAAIMEKNAMENSSYDEDDIELQISQKVIIKKPACQVRASDEDRSNVIQVLLKSDHNQNQTLDDELEDFRHDPMSTHTIADDFCSVGSAEEIVEELNTEEEDEVEEPFLELLQEDTFPDSEIIVLHDTDLNSSIASDAISEDPLAIDDLPTLRDNSATNPLATSSTSDEASTNTADIIWINIDDDIKTSITSPAKPSTDLPEKQTSSPVSERETDSIAENINNKLTSKEEQSEELRSDGSDSGLGSETSTLQLTLNSVTDPNQVSVSATSNATPNPTPTSTPIQIAALEKTKPSEDIFSNTGIRRPLRSNLKRRLDDVEDETLSSLNALANVTTIESQQKKQKRSINFDEVKVYYFPRQQGFGCVPSAGGCTLGMGAHHIAFKTLTLAEHAAELRRAHRLQLQEINPRGSSSDDSEESEEDFLSEGSGSDLDAESNGFLQPVSPKQRRTLLKAAGVRKIDATEKVECRDIRNSREVCGCTCRDFCDPDTCACSQAGIKCQVDRTMFPCGCSRDACGNTVGRVEFNPARVRTHFIHTIMRLEMENRQHPNSPHSYYGMQSQSNYSSGYASPAYTSDQTTTSYYQRQQSSTLYNSQQDLRQTTQYQLDNLDASLFTGSATATPSYGELMPAYGSVSTVTASSSSNYHAMNYSTTTQVSEYSSYHHQASSNYLSPNHVSTTSQAPTYSSCAVPSAPFGTATETLADTQQYHLEGSAPHCTEADDSSFISLNTPIASSSRLSQINDLLQHNRNTTAALVAVTQCPSSESLSSGSASSSNSSGSTAATALLATPTIANVEKMPFEKPLNPTPCVAALDINAPPSLTEKIEESKSN